MMCPLSTGKCQSLTRVPQRVRHDDRAPGARCDVHAPKRRQQRPVTPPKQHSAGGERALCACDCPNSTEHVLAADNFGPKADPDISDKRKRVGREGLCPIPTDPDSEVLVATLE